MSRGRPGDAASTHGAALAARGADGRGGKPPARLQPENWVHAGSSVAVGTADVWRLPTAWWAAAVDTRDAVLSGPGAPEH